MLLDLSSQPFTSLVHHLAAACCGSISSSSFALILSLQTTQPNGTSAQPTSNGGQVLATASSNPAASDAGWCHDQTAGNSSLPALGAGWSTPPAALAAGRVYAPPQCVDNTPSSKQPESTRQRKPACPAALPPADPGTAQFRCTAARRYVTQYPSSRLALAVFCFGHCIVPGCSMLHVVCICLIETLWSLSKHCTAIQTAAMSRATT